MKSAIVAAIAITGLSALIASCGQAVSTREPTGTVAGAPTPTREYQESSPKSTLVGPLPMSMIIDRAAGGEEQAGPAAYSQPRTFTDPGILAGAMRPSDDLRLERQIQEVTVQMNEYLLVGCPPPDGLVSRLAQLEAERTYSATAAVASVEAVRSPAYEALLDELIRVTQGQIDFCVATAQPVPEFMTGALKDLEQAREALQALDEEVRFANLVIGNKIMAGEASNSDLAAELDRIEAARQAILKSVGIDY